MTRGKRTCKILKEIRQEIADKNEIAYTSAECHFEGECQGTCPKCEAELKYIENELHKRTRLGKTATIAGISLGIAGTFSACNTPQYRHNQSIVERKTFPDTNFSACTGIIIYLPPSDDLSLIDTTPKICKPDVYEVVGMVESFPEFKGGEEARLKFLKENLIYPEEAKKQKIEGKVVVEFIVEEDGSLTDIQILKSVSPILDEEVLRIVRLMPKWKPAEQKGKPVRRKQTMPITFSLED